MEVDVRAALSPEEREAVVALVQGHLTLERVVRWGLAHRAPKLIARIVVQDEYTHDVVVPYSGGCFLVYDTT